MNLNKNGWDISMSGDEEVWVYQQVKTDGSRDVFIARFKYANPAKSATHFVQFLMDNFTPEQYFAERAKGTAPLTILEEKGYVSYNVQQSRI